MSLSVKASTKENNKHACNVSNIIYHKDLVVSGSDDGQIKVWKPNLELVSGSEASGGVLSLAACDNILYSCSTGEVIQMWDLDSGKSLGQVSSTLTQPQKLFVDKTKKMLWVGDIQGNVARYEDGKECGRYELVEEIWDILISSDPPLIYTARDRDVVVSEIVTGTSGTRVFTKKTLEGRSPLAVAGNRLCFLNREGRNILIHENSLEKKFPLLSEVPGSEFIINALASASDDVLYAGGYDSTLKKWELNGPECAGSVNLNSCINAIATGSGGDAFVATSDGHISRVLSSRHLRIIVSLLVIYEASFPVGPIARDLTPQLNLPPNDGLISFPV